MSRHVAAVLLLLLVADLRAVCFAPAATRGLVLRGHGCHKANCLAGPLLRAVAPEARRRTAESLMMQVDPLLIAAAGTDAGLTLPDPATALGLPVGFMLGLLGGCAPKHNMLLYACFNGTQTSLIPSQCQSRGGSILALPIFLYFLHEPTQVQLAAPSKTPSMCAVPHARRTTRICRSGSAFPPIVERQACGRSPPSQSLSWSFRLALG
jgi:hypothetical protein